MSFLFFFKQKTAYDLRISDWSSDVCSSGLRDSRDISSNRPPMPTLGARSANKSNDEPTTTANNIKMNTPRRGSVAKVCTDVNTPDRTRKAPRNESENVLMASSTVQFLKLSRFSVTARESINAVPTSHGINEEFSTGSQNHQTPQPSS